MAKRKKKKKKYVRMVVRNNSRYKVYIQENEDGTKIEHYIVDKPVQDERK